MHTLIGQDSLSDLLSGYHFNGDDDLSGSIGGDGTTELIGADELALLMGAQQTPNWKQMGRARQVDPNAVAVIQKRLDTRRKFPLGFPAALLAAGASVQLSTQPQFVFRPERLVVPSDIAFSLRLQDIKVGTQSQLVSTDAIPAAVFSEVAINTGISFRTAEIGNGISYTAINVTANPVNFSAAIIGTSATTGT